MTSTPPGNSEKPDNSVSGLRHRLFYGRDPGPLLGPWLACGILAIVSYIFERLMPAFHDVIGPFYWLLLIIVSIATWRWARARAGGRGADRRHKDRRKADRKAKSKADRKTRG